MVVTMTQSQPQTAITEKPETLQEFLNRPDILARFKGLFPTTEAARRHVQSVLIEVASSEPGKYSLMNCSYESVLKSALRAASLRVSVDRAVRQSWLVPRNNKKSGKLECNLQLHYAEVRNRAMRTGLYHFINVGPVYEGETVFYNIYSGFHQVQLASGLMTSPSTRDGFVPVNSRRGKVIGWLGYYQMKKGAEQTEYMSIEGIIAFITIHNPYWSDSKAWRENRSVMEQKTVLLALLRKADLGDPEMAEVKKIVDDEEGVGQDEDIFDVEPKYVGGDEFDQTPAPQAQKPAPTPAPAPAPSPAVVTPLGAAGKKVLSYQIAKDYIVQGKRLDDRTIDELQVMKDEPKHAESTKAAIRVVLDFKVGQAMMAEKKQ